jgi:ribosomal protein L44E
MTKAAKKIERRMKKLKEKQAQKDIREKVGMFSELEDSCLVCEKAFDKQNKEMVQSWYVIVREEQGKVNLYCPECWGRANSVIEKIKEDMNAQKS